VVFVPQWVEAGLWGLVGGIALVLGAAVAWWVRVSRRVVAGIMAFGAGVLISALAFDLVDARRGARHRKRSGDQQPSEQDTAGSGAAIAVGALLDGIPESVVLGVSLLGGGGIGVTVLAAVFISNVPEGLSSAAGMKAAGRSARYVFGVWSGIAVVSGAAALAGNLLLRTASPATVAAITAVAAGAILAMIADTMIPEAFERTELYTGLLATIGFLTAFVIGHAGG
jgi:ZIP family zinc transporter